MEKNEYNVGVSQSRIKKKIEGEAVHTSIALRTSMFFL